MGNQIWLMSAIEAKPTAEQIEEQFKTSGRAALQIGHQLELAELKRSQCEAASILIRRWWILENLAEQEKNSGSLIDVEAEVRGLVPSIKCKMDPLFIKPENSLEAAKALQQLRAVVRSRHQYGVRHPPSVPSAIPCL